MYIGRRGKVHSKDRGKVHNKDRGVGTQDGGQGTGICTPDIPNTLVDISSKILNI